MNAITKISIPLFLMTGVMAVLLTSCKKEGDNAVTDTDGNIYTNVTIGTQIWMVENLKTTKYNDGTEIPLITDNTGWNNATADAYCWYDNAITNKDLYGALYNWYAVSTGKLCPKGWHVPSESEWAELVNYLGGESVAGGKLKTTGTIEGGDGLWHQPNVDATNETGFSALPGGLRGSAFNDINWGGVWWTSTEYPSNRAYYFYINNNDGSVGDSDDGGSRSSGYSVRCLKDRSMP